MSTSRLDKLWALKKALRSLESLGNCIHTLIYLMNTYFTKAKDLCDLKRNPSMMHTYLDSGIRYLHRSHNLGSYR